MKYILRILFFIFLLGTLFYNGAITQANITLISQVKAAFALPLLVFKNIFISYSLTKELSILRLENQDLRAKILALNLDVRPESRKLYPAKVHAQYPFNNKSTITIAAGRDTQIYEGAAILASEYIFLGTVVKVDDTWSEVQTIFDPQRQLPVRIGKNGIPALLIGGGNVTVTMIDKSKNIVEGDEVYVGSRDLPYGFKIGNLTRIRENSATAFKEADVLLPYALSDLNQVFIYLK